jgi:murein DD-endopeptidase MepM/ murein hydrolase activator NlpD
MITSLPSSSAFALVALCAACGQASAQTVVNNEPISIPLVLSGNFGEVRGAHLHYGIDIKAPLMTPVRAVWDGTVARIKVDPDGYGKVLYIAHPNGMTSVYAHLNRLSDEMAEWLKERQYQEQTDAVDVKPFAGKMSIKAGQVIGYTGNTGRSSGPHLHFELRDRDENTLDPFAYGIKVPDTRRPVLSSVTVYPHGANAQVDGANVKKRFEVRPGTDGTFALEPKEIRVSGTVSLGIGNHDLLDGADNKCGNRSMKVEVDGREVYAHNIDKVGFDWARGVLSSIDVGQRLATEEVVQRTYIAPANPMPIYMAKEANGMMSLANGERKQVKVTVTDRAGNQSTLAFTLVGVPPKKQPTDDGPLTTFLPLADNTYSHSLFQISAPKGSLFDTLVLRASAQEPCAGCASDVVLIGQPDISLMKAAKVRLPLPKGAKPDGMGLFRMKGGGKLPEFCGNEPVNGMIEGETRDLGRFMLMQDMIPPVLRPLNVKDGAQVAHGDTLKWSLRDNLTGIAYYKGFCQSGFMLLEYDPKNDLLYHVVDDRTPSGTVNMGGKVQDGMGNATEFTFSFRK